MSNVTVLLGFEGKSFEPGKYRRLYCTPELTEYVEFLKDDVAYEQKAEIGPLRLSGMMVGVDREAELRVTRAGTEEYLHGEIASAWRAAGGSIEGGTTHVTTLATRPPWCALEPSFDTNCPPQRTDYTSPCKCG